MYGDRIPNNNWYVKALVSMSAVDAAAPTYFWDAIFCMKNY